MILIYILVILAVIAGSFWLFDSLLAEQNNVVLYWSGHSLELSVANVVAALLIAFLAFYIVLRLLKHLISIAKYTHNFRQRNLRKRTRNGLMQGMLSLIEGNWDKAESLLLADASHSEAPVLHYLGAARAAHLREAYELRDQYLKQANETNEASKGAYGAGLAISISQAEMQLYSEQLEQARAGLITLLEDHPKHHYAKRLLAKSYYKQEDWKNLSAMLPEMNKLAMLNEKESERYETLSLKGIFQMYANADNLSKLKLEWKKLPANIRNKPNAILLYCKALLSAGDNSTANKLMATTLSKQWDDQIAQQYGLSTHDNQNQAIRQAEKWLPDHDKSPVFLLCMARLYRNNQLWGKARNFFESSLNLAPNAEGYLEFAKLLEETGEKTNAELCYKVGLHYCIHKKGQPLTLNNRRETNRLSKPELEVIRPPVSDYAIDLKDEATDLAAAIEPSDVRI